MNFLLCFDGCPCHGLQLIGHEAQVPQYAQVAPGAPLVHADEAEAVERHGVGVVVEVCVEELVGGDVLSVVACALPHVQEFEVILLRRADFQLPPRQIPCCVQEAAVAEGATSAVLGEDGGTRWAVGFVIP